MNTQAGITAVGLPGVLGYVSMVVNGKDQT